MLRSKVGIVLFAIGVFVLSEADDTSSAALVSYFTGKQVVLKIDMPGTQTVTEHDGTLYVLCFSDDGPDTGPHPISHEELRAAFNPSTEWNVAAIEAERIQTRFHDDGAPAWFATIKRV